MYTEIIRTNKYIKMKERKILRPLRVPNRQTDQLERITIRGEGKLGFKKIFLP